MKIWSAVIKVFRIAAFDPEQEREFYPQITQIFADGDGLEYEEVNHSSTLNFHESRF